MLRTSEVIFGLLVNMGGWGVAEAVFEATSTKNG